MSSQNAPWQKIPVSHCTVLVSGPVQVPPGATGTGLVQARLSVLAPIPQVTEQAALPLDQVVHPPSTPKTD